MGCDEMKSTKETICTEKILFAVLDEEKEVNSLPELQNKMWEKVKEERQTDRTILPPPLKQLKRILRRAERDGLIKIDLRDSLYRSGWSTTEDRELICDDCVEED